MKLIIDIILVILWNALLVLVYQNQLTTDLNSFGVLKYFLIWLMGFSTGGFVMLYLIKCENSKNEKGYVDYKCQYKNENIKTVPPTKSESPNRPPRQR